MIRARHSSDPWAVYAHRVLDDARNGHRLPEHIEWALNYLGDGEGGVKIPRSLMNGHRRVPCHTAA